MFVRTRAPLGILFVFAVVACGSPKPEPDGSSAGGVGTGGGAPGGGSAGGSGESGGSNAGGGESAGGSGGGRSSVDATELVSNQPPISGLTLAQGRVFWLATPGGLAAASIRSIGLDAGDPRVDVADAGVGSLAPCLRVHDGSVLWGATNSRQLPADGEVLAADLTTHEQRQVARALPTPLSFDFSGDTLVIASYGTFSGAGTQGYRNNGQVTEHFTDGGSRYLTNFSYASFLALDPANARRLFVSGDRLLSEVDVDSGLKVESVGMADRPFVAAGAAFYTDASGTIRRFVSSTSSPQVISGSARLLAADDQWLYYAPASRPGSLWRAAHDGGAALELVSSLSRIGEVAVGAGQLVVADCTGSSPITCRLLVRSLP